MLKPEILRVLEREQRMCETAISRLEERARPWEDEYGWSTTLFLEKFNSGEAGDELIFFQWYAVAEAIKDWQKTYTSLNELLTGAELIYA